MDPLSGLADLQDILRPGGRRIAREFGADDRYMLMPSGLVLESRPDGRPDLAIDFVTDRTTDDPANCLYAMIEMGLSLSDDALAAHRDLQGVVPGGTLLAAALMPEAWWLLELPFMAPIARPMSWSGPRSTRLIQRVSEKVGMALYSGLKAGGASLRCAVQADVACVAPRLPLVATASTAELLRALRGLAPGRDSVPYDRMHAAFLEGGVGMAALRLDGPREPDDRVRLACAMALHLRMRLGHAVPTPSILEGPHIALPDPGDPSLPVELSFDLATPLLAREPVLLTGDPFAVAARAAGENINGLTSFSRVRSFDAMTRLHVTVASSLPRAIQNVSAIDTTLRIRPELTPHGNAFVKTISLLPSTKDGGVVEMAFRDPSRKIYSLQVSMLIGTDTQLHSEELDEDDEFLLVDSSLLPAQIATVSAGASLRKQAALAARLIGKAGQTVSVAQITDATPAVSFALETADGNVIEIEASDPGDGTRSRSLSLPARSVALDSFSFRGYGANAVSVTVTFKDRGDPVRFEFEPEAPGAEPLMLTFTPAAPAAVFRYSATDIFRYRYRWRPASEGTWSEYRDPATPLVLDAGGENDRAS